MKLREILTKGTAFALSGLISMGSALGAAAFTPLTTVHAAEVTDAAGAPTDDRKVMLGTSGLSNPSNPFGDDWIGNFVYFGNLGNYPICFRVLDKNNNDFGSNSLLLDANYGLLRKVYSENGSADWANSDVRRYLNSEFYEGNFSEAERAAILTSSRGSMTGDKVFLLDAAEATNGAYGYAKGGAITKENMKIEVDMATWLLRSEGEVQGVDATGDIVTLNAAEPAYISPAINVSKSSILFTYPANESKPAYFAATGAATDAFLKLTIEGGSGFTAARKGGDTTEVPAGYGFMVDVNSIGTPMRGVNYTQISGLLKDSQGNVAAYGLLSNVAATGEILIPVPSTVPAGSYTLCVFAEDVESDRYDHATDYASNFAEIPVTITDANVVSPEAQAGADAAREAQAEEASGNKKSSGQQAETVTAVDHAIRLESAGGSVQASVGTAKVGTVVMLTPTPDKDYHFKAWESSDVSVAGDNKFTMPDKDVTVKAVFEKNASNHAVISDATSNGTLWLSANAAAKGQNITAEARPAAGYHFAKWETSGLASAPNNSAKTSFEMPDNDVHIRPVFEKNEAQKYNITVNTNGNGSAAANTNSAPANTWVTLSVSPANGSRFVRWESNEVNPGGQNKFLMPEKNVTVTAVFEQIPESTYAVSTNVQGEGGRIWVTDEQGNSRTAFKKGEKVYVRYDKDRNVQLDSLRADNVDLTTEGSTNQKYFYMPDRSVTVSAVFSRKQEASYTVATRITGNGNAWTTDGNGNAKTNFNEGETVWVQWNTNGSQLESVTTDVGGTNQDQNTKAFYFTMPGRNLNVYVKYRDPSPYHKVYLRTDGDGSAWLTDSSGNRRDTFRKDEEVRVEWFTNTGELAGVTADGANISQISGSDTFHLYMPDRDVTVAMVFRNKQPATHQVYAMVTKGSGQVAVANSNMQGTNTFAAGDRVMICVDGGGVAVSAVRATANDGGNIDVQTQTENAIYFITMPDQDVKVTVELATDTKYHVGVSASGGGSIRVVDAGGNERYDFSAGEEVRVVVDYHDCLLADIGADAAPMAQINDNTWVFAMPQGNVNVYAAFQQPMFIMEEPDMAAVPVVVGEDGEIYTVYDE